MTRKAKSAASTARIAALSMTREIRERNAYARDVVGAWFGKTAGGCAMSPEDEAFARLLVFGTVSCTCVLDELIDRSLSSPRDVKPDVRDALRLSAYEMLFLGKPPYAAVSQGVELVRSFRPQASGLANKVLRRMSEDAAGFPWGDADEDLGAFARLHGYPLWMAEMLVEDRGMDGAREVMCATDAVAPVYVSINPFHDDTTTRAALAGIDPGAEPFGVAGCMRLCDAPPVLESDLVSGGDLVVADATGQLVAALAAPGPGETFCEVASGRGTKTYLMQAALSRAGRGLAEIHSVDIHAFKSQILAERMELLGVRGVMPHVGDATHLEAVPALPGKFDGAFVDAPCTGLGTLRRHPEQRMRVRPEDVPGLSDLGLSMLASSASRVRVGGSLVYATCTLSRAEDEGVIERFLDGGAPAATRRDGACGARASGAAGPDDGISGGVPGRAFPGTWEVEPFSRFELDAAGAPWAGLTPEGYLLNLPKRGCPDGFFAARLRRIS